MLGDLTWRTERDDRDKDRDHKEKDKHKESKGSEVSRLARNKSTVSREDRGTPPALRRPS